MAGEIRFIVTDAETLMLVRNLISNSIFKKERDMEVLNRFVEEDAECKEKYELASRRRTLLKALEDQIKESQPATAQHAKAYWEKFFEKEKLVEQVYLQERLLIYCANEIKRIALKWGKNSRLIENAKGHNLMPLLAKAIGVEMAKPFTARRSDTNQPFKAVLAMDGVHLLLPNNTIGSANSLALQHICLGLYRDLKQEKDENEEKDSQNNTKTA